MYFVWSSPSFLSIGATKFSRSLRGPTRKRLHLLIGFCWASFTCLPLRLKGQQWACFSSYVGAAVGAGVRFLRRWRWCFLFVWFFRPACVCGLSGVGAGVSGMLRRCVIIKTQASTRASASADTQRVLTPRRLRRRMLPLPQHAAPHRFHALHCLFAECKI